VRHAAQHLGLADDAVDRVHVAGVGAALVADLQKLARLALRQHHGLRLLELVRHLLLAVDVLAGLEAGAGVLGVHPVGRRDDHAVDVLVLFLEHLAVVFVNGHFVPERFQAAAGHFAAVVPDVAHGLELHAGDLHGGVGQNLTFRAVTDHGNIDLIVFGADRLGLLAQDVEGRQDRGGGRRGLEELSAVE
jgi:hypothetical protein